MAFWKYASDFLPALSRASFCSGLSRLKLRFDISTGGWSGNEDIIGALEQNQMFHMLCPVSWRRGGHYIYDVQEWSNDEPRKLIRDPATPMHGSWSVAICEHEVQDRD